MPGGPPPSASSSGSLDGARFAPGTLLAGRYRVVGRLGRGGMGEVYRAEDLKLREEVALKLLPEELTRDGAALARLHREVRLARQVAHPNVCRVHDIGESESRQTGSLHFVTMELIDGEDLASLLRRIGRLPEGKAVEIARQLCAGLAAAHDAGVLHRDLKPANVMVDGRGRAKIADFGLADAEGDVVDGLAGTPAYMAPEQLDHGAATVRSDLYALGLVLYELFTGERAFPPPPRASLGELLEQRREAPPSPSLHVAELDPAVERAVLRCLAPDPEERPRSAREVAAALPGGDPLAAALAAGETPSPEMVAGAAQAGTLRPAVGAALLAAILVALAAAVHLLDAASVHGIVDPAKPPAVMEERAREVLADLGWPRDDVPYAFGSYDYDADAYHWHRDRTAGGGIDPALRPSPLVYWWRAAPAPLLARGNWGHRFDEPPLHEPGEARIVLDPAGRLVSAEVLATPAEMAATAPEAAEVDWNALLGLAGLDASRLAPAEPRDATPLVADLRVAWTGSFPGQDKPPLRVEAAAWRGRVVHLALRYSDVAPDRRAAKVFAVTFGIVVPIALWAGGVYLARRNLSAGRGDRRGATRAAGAVLVLTLASWAVATPHVAAMEEAASFFDALGSALLGAAATWIFYVSCEPLVRRVRPRALVGWTRLLAGRWRDPLVGRDVLVGVLVGVAAAAVVGFESWLGLRLGWPGALALDTPFPTLVFAGARGVAGFLAMQLGLSLTVAVAFLVVFAFVHRIVRRDGAALAVFVLVVLAMAWADGHFGDGHPLRNVPFGLLHTAIAVVVVVRFGLLATVAWGFSTTALRFSPVSWHLDRWYAEPGLLTILLVAGLAVWAYHHATAPAARHDEHPAPRTPPVARRS